MEVKKKILFVDDESKVLDGLRRMLCSMRAEWDMKFVLGGREALEALENTRYDIIISDMRMPQMDGLQLLTIIKDKYPHLVRIALSGQTSQETLLRSAAGSIHQYLSKPCDKEELESVIAQACSLQQLQVNRSLQSILSQLDSLPSLPSVCTDLMHELRSENASITNAAQIIAQDVGMGMKILQLVNSSFFGVSRQVTSITHAVSLLGLDTIQALVLSIKIFSYFDNISLPGFSLQQLWDHCLKVGDVTKKIASLEHAPQEIIDNAVLAGTLHDVGKLILASKIPQQYELVLAQESPDRLPCQVEDEIFGTTHAQVGAYLLGLWGFPNLITETVAFHHDPQLSPKTGFTPLTAVCVADALSRDTQKMERSDYFQDVICPYLEKVGLSNRLPVWIEACSQELVPI
jgi:HD-like signal output (HDOD) protein